MKKKGILFSLLSMLCLGLVAGCGEDTYKISAVPENYEYGYVTGGGEFTMGSSVNLKIYTNTGCKFDRLVLTKNNKRIEEYTNLTYMNFPYKLN